MKWANLWREINLQITITDTKRNRKCFLKFIQETDSVTKSLPYK